MARGAMGNNPPRTMQRTPEQLGLQRLSAGVYRDKQGNLTDSTGRITRRAQQPKPATPSPTPAPAPVTPPPPPVQQQPAPTPTSNQITMGRGEFAQGTSFDRSALPGDFNWQTYVNNYEDLRKAGIDTENEALAHYYLHGRTEGRNYGAPSPVQQQPAPTVNPNQITMGKGEFAQGTSFDKSALPGDFNWQTYVNNYEDLRKAGINTENEALAHYYLHGRTEGRNYGGQPQQQPAPVQTTPGTPPPQEKTPTETPPPIVGDTTGGTGGTGTGAFGTDITNQNMDPTFTAEKLFGSAGQFYTDIDPRSMGSMVQPQFTQQMQQAGDAIYNEFSRRAEPEFERQRAALEQQMYERGLDPNSQGARLQMDQLMQQQNDARQSIRNQATQQAMAYQQQLFGQGQTIYGQPAEIASKLSAPYLESMRLQGEATARKENLANDLTKLATQFGNDEKLLAQDIAGKLQIGNFDLEADLKKLKESSNNTVRELGVQLENDLAKIKASGAMDLKLAKVQGQTSRDVARIGGSASVRGQQIAADASTFDTIMRAYGIGDGGGGSTSAKNKFMEKLLEIGGPAVIKAITGG